MIDAAQRMLIPRNAISTQNANFRLHQQIAALFHVASPPLTVPAVNRRIPASTPLRRGGARDDRRPAAAS